jgi:hypothetical protein
MNETAARPKQVYDASDDFGELNIDDVEFDELPDWLQSMAPSTPAQPEPEPPDHGRDQPTPDDLPDWLREPPADSATIESTSRQTQRDVSTPPSFSEQQSVDHQPADQFSLVSDEDLPDWLKALSDEDDDTSSISAAPSTPASRPYSSAPSTTTALANLYDVPPINRAWSAQGRYVDQEQAATAQREFLPLEALSNLAEQQSSVEEGWDTTSMDQADDTDQETRPFSVPEAEGDESGDRGRLIARVVILVLLVIVLVLLGYVLWQGL